MHSSNKQIHRPRHEMPSAGGRTKTDRDRQAFALVARSLRFLPLKPAPSERYSVRPRAAPLREMRPDKLFYYSTVPAHYSRSDPGKSFSLTIVAV